MANKAPSPSKIAFCSPIFNKNLLNKMQHCSKFVMRFTSRPSRQRLMNHSYWNHSVLISKIQRLNEHLENPCLQSAAGIDDRARHRLLSFSLSLPPSLPPLPPPPSTPLFLSFSLWFHWTIYCVHCSCCIINITKLQFHFFPTRSGYGLRVALAAHARPLVCVSVCVFASLFGCWWLVGRPTFQCNFKIRDNNNSGS